MNRRLASGSVRSRSTRRMFWVISRKVAGWMSRSFSCATWNRRRIATGSLAKASGAATASRSPSRRKPSSSRGRKVCHRAASLGLRRRLSSSAATKMRVRSPTDLGVQVIVLGETLDAAAARPVLVAEPRGDLALQVERQAIVGAAGQIVDVAAHRGEEALGALEVARLLLGEHALGDQLAGLAHAIEILGDPEQQVQVAQPALALLDVGLDDVARIAHALVALVALGELGLDEVAAVAGQEFLGEALDQLVEQLAVAPHVARLEQARCGWSGRARRSAGSRRRCAWRGRPSAPCPTAGRA